MNTKNINERNGKKVFTWCKKKYGRSEYHSRYPKLFIIDYPPKEDFDFKGEFFEKENKMNIYKSNHISFIDFVRTIIHEYVHYLQDDKMYQRYTRVHRKSYNYHPYELSAVSISIRDCRECFKDVFSKNKKK